VEFFILKNTSCAQGISRIDRKGGSLSFQFPRIGVWDVAPLGRGFTSMLRFSPHFAHVGRGLSFPLLSLMAACMVGIVYPIYAIPQSGRELIS